MVFGDRLKQLREGKEQSQGDIEKKTGLLRCYISRVENGHTVPSLETIEKFARALEIPVWMFFADEGNKKRTPISLDTNGSRDDIHLRQLRAILPKLKQTDRGIVVKLAKSLAHRAA